MFIAAALQTNGILSAHNQKNDYLSCALFFGKCLYVAGIRVQADSRPVNH